MKPIKALCRLATLWLALSVVASPQIVQSQDDPLEAMQMEAVKLYQQGKIDPAIAKGREVLKIREKILGPDSLEVASSLRILGVFMKAKGDFEQAEALFVRAYEIRKKKLKANHPMLADSLYDLGTLAFSRGDYVKAETLLKQAIAVREKELGPNHPTVAVMLNDLGVIVKQKGDFAQTHKLFERVLEIRLKHLPPGHVQIGQSYNNLASVTKDLKRYDEAERLYLKALAIWSRTLPPKHPRMATLFNNLGLIYDIKGDFDKAKDYYLRAISIDQEVRGMEHPALGTQLGNLGYLLLMAGKADSAETFLKRALYVRQKGLGNRHPLVAMSQQDMVRLRMAQDKTDEAFEHLKASRDIHEYNLSLILSVGSEAQRRAYMETLWAATNLALSFHMHTAPDDAQAAELALETLLQRKGRVLDAQADTFAMIRRTLGDEGRELLEKLEDLRTRQAALVFGGRKGDLETLESDIDALEQTLAQKSATFQSQARPVTLKEIQAHIPEDAALVELTVFHPVLPKATKREEALGEPRYAAYVLTSSGSVRWVDLGPTAALDAQVESLRQGIIGREDVTEASRSLFTALWAPLLPLMKGAPHVLLSPDGQLNLLPFDALIDDKGRFFIETHQITYLTTGRDLLRMDQAAPERGGDVLIADPDYDAGATGQEAGQDGLPRAGELDGVTWGRLPGTVREAKAISGVLDGASLTMGAQATEAALKEVAGPRILHLATHGFFLEDRVSDAQGDVRGFVNKAAFTLETKEKPSGQMARTDDPLLRSGLVLAGANKPTNSLDDGYATASEIAGLDLWGTRLVVMSACETGLGEVRNGQGVFGLRRALVLAGAQSQVMSLWQVSDDATEVLMVAYYKHLKKGLGRSRALREARLDLMDKDSENLHPFFWAAFIPSGDWRNLKGESQTIDPVSFVRAPKGPRGCACQTPAAPAPAPWPLVWCVLMGGVWTLRARRT